MRKIGANYIFLPGFPLVKNGYLLWDNGEVTDVVNTGGGVKEIQGLEFYGGLIVAGYVKGMRERLKAGEDIVSVLNELYQEKGYDYQSLALVEGADLLNRIFRENITIQILR